MYKGILVIYFENKQIHLGKSITMNSYWTAKYVDNSTKIGLLGQVTSLSLDSCDRLFNGKPLVCQKDIVDFLQYYFVCRTYLTTPKSLNF